MGVALLDGVVDLRPSFFADLGVVAWGVVIGLGVELFSLPAFLTEWGDFGVTLTCS